MIQVVAEFFQDNDWGVWLSWLGIILVAVIGAILFFDKKKPPTITEIQLRDLSVLWAKDGAKVIHIAELSPLWRDGRTAPDADEYPALQNPRAADFMKNIRQWSWFEKFPQQKAICGQILKMLDQQGHCPSVVNIHGDVEGAWDESTYQILAQTTLLDHSLNVAENVVQLLSEAHAWHVIPDTLIAALAHDLGKVESLRGYLYSLGEHPLAAGRPLAGFDGFRDLPKKDEILRAIKLHHKKTDGLLGKTLKKADQLARQQELEEAALKDGQRQRIDKLPQAFSTSESLQKKMSPSAVTMKSLSIDVAKSAWRAQADIYDENSNADQENPGTESIKLVDISGWFDATSYLAELQLYINRMFGRRFMAFSMPEGHIYFQVKVLEEVARKQAERAGCMEIATMAPKDPSMRQVLFTIVHHLRVDHGVIARGLIKDAFFGGYFTVSRKIGRSIKGYYTPFHAEAFGSIAAMEQAKPEMLRDIDKVSPLLDGKGLEDA